MLEVEKAPVALYRRLERLEVEHGGERKSSSLEYAGLCRDARESLFLY